MNKTPKVKSLLLPMIIASAGILVGCTNSDYDFDGIDFTLGFGGNELLIPTSSTREIALDDILTLSEDGCVKIFEDTENPENPKNGDYMFIQEGSEIDPIHPSIDIVTLEGSSTSEDYPIGDILRSAAEAGSKRRSLEKTIDINSGEPHEIIRLEYSKEDKPEEILDLKHVGVNVNMQLDIDFSNVKNIIKKFDVLTLDFPHCMVIDAANVGSGNIKINKANQVIINDILTNNNVQIIIHVSKLTFDYPEELAIRGNNIELNGAVKMSFQTQATVDSEQDFSNCVIRSNMALGNIVINSGTGRFNPTIDLENLGDVEVTGIPEFLKEDGVVIDLANPQILVEISNDMDVDATLDGTLSSLKDGKEQKNIGIKGLIINRNATTKYSICRVNSDEGYTPYPVADLSELMNPIPNNIQFSAVTTAIDEESTIELGDKDESGEPRYTIQPSYSIVAPIAFGEEARIVYTDSIDDMHGDIDGLELEKDAYVEVSADVYNKLPVYLNTSVIPMDVNGKDISSSVTINVDNNIPAAEAGEAKQGALKIKIGGDIKKLDKLKFRIEGAAKKEGMQTITGVTLNKNKHSLKLENVKAKIVGKVIYDAN